MLSCSWLRTASCDPISDVPPDLVAFWQQLPKAQLCGRLLCLAPGTCFMADSELGGTLYVREDYKGMLAELLRSFDAGARKLVISGSPGIGKSWFGLYFLHYLATAGSTTPYVVWEASLENRRYLFSAGEVAVGDLRAFADVLQDRAAWCANHALNRTPYAGPAPASARPPFIRATGRYLVDEAVPPGPVRCKARTLLFSSPKRENYRLLLKAVASSIRYMPVWSKAEIEECRQLMYGDDTSRSVAAVQNAFNRWGGIPRYVLEKLNDAGAQQLLDEAIDSANPGAIELAFGAVDAATDASHRLVHINAKQPYVFKSISFGSQYILGELLRKNAVYVGRLTGLSAQVMSGVPSLASARGSMFEAGAHSKICAGGVFRVRRLGVPGAEPEDVVLPRRTERMFQAVDEMRAGASEEYWRPASRTFAAADAVAPPNQLFQMTVSPSHGVNHAGLIAVLQELPLTGQRVDLYFVVPPEIFDTFAEQSFVGRGGKVLKRKSALVQKVDQWVLRVPASQQASQLRAAASCSAHRHGPLNFSPGKQFQAAARRIRSTSEGAGRTPAQAHLAASLVHKRV